MEVLELKGYQSLKAFQAFHTLLLGMKMLPMYALEDYSSFYTRVSEMSEAQREGVIKEALLFVDLTEDEVISLCCFCKDQNGIAYGRNNIKNLSPDKLIEIQTAVCLEISKIKINLITEEEKKN